MLNLFPIQFLALLAYFLLRVTVGAILVASGAKHLQHRKKLKKVFSFPFLKCGAFFAATFAVGEIIVGALFIAGAWTQLAALATALMSVKLLIMRRRFAPPHFPEPVFYILLLAASLSLFITGGGAFAFDLPI